MAIRADTVRQHFVPRNVPAAELGLQRLDLLVCFPGCNPDSKHGLLRPTQRQLDPPDGASAEKPAPVRADTEVLVGAVRFANPHERTEPLVVQLNCDRLAARLFEVHLLAELSHVSRVNATLQAEVRCHPTGFNMEPRDQPTRVTNQPSYNGHVDREPHVDGLLERAPHRPDLPFRPPIRILGVAQR